VLRSTCSEEVSGECQVTKGKRGKVTPLKTEVWTHTHTFIRTCISINASRHRVARSWVLSKKVKSQKNDRVNYPPFLADQKNTMEMYSCMHACM